MYSSIKIFTYRKKKEERKKRPSWLYDYDQVLSERILSFKSIRFESVRIVLDDIKASH